MSNFNFNISTNNISSVNLDSISGSLNTTNITTNSSGKSTFVIDTEGIVLQLSGVSIYKSDTNLLTLYSIKVPFNVNYGDVLQVEGNPNTTYQMIISKFSDTNNITTITPTATTLNWYNPYGVFYSYGLNSFLYSYTNLTQVLTETGAIGTFNNYYRGVFHNGVQFEEDSTYLYSISGYRYNKLTGALQYCGFIQSAPTDISIGQKYIYISSYISGLAIIDKKSFLSIANLNQTLNGALSIRVVCALSSDTCFVVPHIASRIDVFNGTTKISGLTTVTIVYDIINASDGYIYACSSNSLYKIDPNSISIVSTLLVGGYPITKITECNGKLLTIGSPAWNIVSLNSFTIITGGTISGNNFVGCVAIGTKCYATIGNLTYAIKVFDMVNNTLSNNNNLIGYPLIYIAKDTINNRIAVYTYINPAPPAIMYPTIIYRAEDLT